MKKQSHRIHEILFWIEDSKYCATCLRCEIMVFGWTKKEALRLLTKVLKEKELSHINHERQISLG